MKNPRLVKVLVGLASAGVMGLAVWARRPPVTDVGTLDTGGNVLAIAHNGNLSNGRMLPVVESFTGKPVDREYAEQRARRERLYEAPQIKGDAGAHPFLSPNIEIPTPRWTAYDANRFGIRMDTAVPMTTQERAYTSPIWYTPK